jgi:hypothetical protein
MRARWARISEPRGNSRVIFYTPRHPRALALLIDEINTTPPSLPGDQRPITYPLAKPAQSI